MLLTGGGKGGTLREEGRTVGGEEGERRKGGVGAPFLRQLPVGAVLK